MILCKPQIKFDWRVKSTSIFYMPLISHAYLLASDLQVIENVIFNTGNLINLGISQEIYNEWVFELVDYLKIEENLRNLDNNFKNDTFPSKNSTGHINRTNQITLLKKVYYNNFNLNSIINSYIFDKYQIKNNFFFK